MSDGHDGVSLNNEPPAIRVHFGRDTFSSRVTDNLQTLYRHGETLIFSDSWP